MKWLPVPIRRLSPIPEEWPEELASLAWRRGAQDASRRTRRAADPHHGPALNWLFVDLNSYFASVEQEARPELRGRPVGVVPMMADTTCCIAASYEAKAFGVRTGTIVADAKRMCPEIVLVEGRHELYTEYHHRVVEAVESCVPVTAVCSIDEMACRLMGRERPLRAAIDLGMRVKASHPRARGRNAAQLRGPGDESLSRQDCQRHGKARWPGGAAAGHSARGAAQAHAARSARHRRAHREAAERKRHPHRWTICWRSIANRPARSGDRCGASGCGTGCAARTSTASEIEHQKSISHSHVLAPEMRTAGESLGRGAQAAAQGGDAAARRRPVGEQHRPGDRLRGAAQREYAGEPLRRACARLAQRNQAERVPGQPDADRRAAPTVGVAAVGRRSTNIPTSSACN